MPLNCENCENTHFCLTLSWKEDIDARVIDVYHKISYGKEYCSKIEGSKWNEILKLRESGLKDSEIIEKISKEKIAEMVRYVKEKGIELPETIKEQCRKEGYEV
jgi:hypothetical protein